MARIAFLADWMTPGPLATACRGSAGDSSTFGCCAEESHVFSIFLTACCTVPLIEIAQHVNNIRKASRADHCPQSRGQNLACSLQISGPPGYISLQDQGLGSRRDECRHVLQPGHPSVSSKPANGRLLTRNGFHKDHVRNAGHGRISPLTKSQSSQQRARRCLARCAAAATPFIPSGQHAVWKVCTDAFASI